MLGKLSIVFLPIVFSGFYYFIIKGIFEITSKPHHEKFDNSDRSLEEVKTLLSIYAAHNDSHSRCRPGRKMAFGYVADIDITVNAVPYMKDLGFKTPKPKYHPYLKTLEEVSETFAFFYSAGAATELYVSKQDVFDVLVANARKNAKKTELGGNAAMMAQRAYLEGCQVLLGSEMDDHNYERFYNRSIELIHPPKEIKDIHLVLDYYEDDVWGDVKPPRTNRFYLNHDVVNTNLSLLEDFHDRVEQFQPQILVITGFQLLSNRPSAHNEDRLGKMASYLVKRPSTQKVHLEFAAMTDPVLYNTLIDTGFRNVDSVGMNEQELSSLIHFLSHRDMLEKEVAKPNINEFLQKAVDLLALFKYESINVTRIHVHTINCEVICATKEWGKQELPLIKSVLLANRLSAMSDVIIPENLKLVIPKNFLLPKINGEIEEVEFDINQPIHTWQAAPDFTCHAAPQFYNKRAVRTQGLGDHISSVALIYSDI